jgi:hypothetical protein
MKKVWVTIAVAAGCHAVACGGSPSEPTAAATVKTPVVSTGPTASASPSPSPSPTPQTSVSLPPGMSCGSPTPPPLYRMVLKIHAKDGNRTILDSTPQVLNVNGYCEKAGFGDWKFCETRPEGHPERVACDYLVVGRSEETGRWGPTWYYQDQELCGTDEQTCVNHPTEQFMAVAKKPGAYQACIASDRSVEPGSSRCGEVQVE